MAWLDADQVTNEYFAAFVGNGDYRRDEFRIVDNGYP